MVIFFCSCVDFALSDILKAMIAYDQNMFLVDVYILQKIHDISWHFLNSIRTIKMTYKYYYYLVKFRL